MTLLRKTFVDVASRIRKHGKSPRINEQNTKATLIEPVLRALGWDLEDIDEVQREFKPKRRDNPVDYALLTLRSPRLFVEAKALGHDLNDRKWAGQIMGYAGVAGVEWVVLTNGDEYRIYNAHAPVGVEEKLFRKVRISDDEPAVEETLALLSKDHMQQNSLEVLWRAQFVDRQVRAAIENLFSDEVDPAIVRLLCKKIPSLKGSDIKASLRRMRIALEFPLDDVGVSATETRATEAPAPTPAKKRPAAASAGSSAGEGVTIANLVRAGLLKPGAKLTKTYKGEPIEATILEDGSLRCAGEVFESPSSAGAAARASVLGLDPSAKRPATNGWEFWKCVDATGASVPLSHLRASYVAETSRSGSADSSLRILKGGA